MVFISYRLLIIGHFHIEEIFNNNVYFGLYWVDVWKVQWPGQVIDPLLRLIIFKI